ncbi:hypothetical protein [Streptomyces sp. UG1]|uniref:hypothetical protein n=1 Tax=Streptomyces sp. UG1 TaxID=3417652 RepID=UPI003CF72827
MTARRTRPAAVTLAATGVLATALALAVATGFTARPKADASPWCSTSPSPTRSSCPSP